MSKKVALGIFACLSPLLFPWQLVLLITLIASWYFPWTAMMVGVIEDMLYAPDVLSHTGFFIGVGVSLIVLGVRYLFKTRIMVGHD